jgi:hypothetical protein
MLCTQNLKTWSVSLNFVHWFLCMMWWFQPLCIWLWENKSLNPYVTDWEIIKISWTHICLLTILFLRLQSPLEIYFDYHISVFSLVCKFWILNKMDQSTIVQKQDTWISKWKRASMHSKYDSLISTFFLNYIISTKWADSNQPSEFQKTLYVWKWSFSFISKF